MRIARAHKPFNQREQKKLLIHHLQLLSKILNLK